MKALITGGAGFIGSYLAEQLIKEGHTVYVIDDLSTGCIDNIDHLKQYPTFHYTIESIMNFPLLKEMVDRVDIVFHLAAAVGVRLIVDDPVRTIVTNIKGTELVLNAALQKKKKILLASTSEVYGKGKNELFTEEDDLVFGPTTRNRWSYACSKAIDEFLALAYWKQNGLPVNIVRFFNTVGPRQTGQYGMVIPRFVKQALNAEPISVYGDGTHTRTFCHVKDVVRALLEIVKCEKAIGEIFNIGSDQVISMNDLANRVIELSQSKSKIQHISFEDAYGEGFEDIKRRRPNVSKLKKYINFTTQYSIDEILKDVIAHMQNKRELFQNFPEYS